MPNVKARLTSTYDYFDDVSGVVELEVIPNRPIHVEDLELEVVDLDEVMGLLS